MRCLVCGLDGARQWHTVGGSAYGPACEGECAVLAWEAHFERAAGAPQWEHDVLAWQWRRQSAHRRGVRFDEGAPVSPAERALESVVVGNGWVDVAAELE